MEDPNINTYKKPINRRLEQQYTKDKFAADKQNYNETNFEIPQSYLLAMRSLQQKVDSLLIENQSINSNLQQTKAQNYQLKNMILQNEQEKLFSQTKINNILRDYNTLNEILDQCRLENMVLKKQVQQLKKQKQNVLEKVTQKVCKERAVAMLQNRQSQKKRSINKLSSSKKELKEYPIYEKYQKTNLKQSSKKVNRYQYKQSGQPLISQRISQQTLYNPNIQPNIQPNTQRYQQYSESSNSNNYITTLKEIMRNEKLLVEMNHQLERYEKQLIQKGDKKQSNLIQKINVLNDQIKLVKKTLQQARSKQNY